MKYALKMFFIMAYLLFVSLMLILGIFVIYSIPVSNELISMIAFSMAFIGFEKLCGLCEVI